MRCDECLWFQDKEFGGRCRKESPKMIQICMDGESWGESRWPLVEPGDYCGDYKPRKGLQGETAQ